MSSKFFYGPSLLEGNNTTPGLQLSEEEKKYFSITLKKCQDWGLDFFPTVIHKLTGSEMSEVAAYGGFPIRYPHWGWGMEYEGLQKGYEYGMHRIYEMVINNDPCHLYLLNTNPLMDNILVVAHATGHNDFFKNNLHFQHTDRHMIDTFANHSKRIRRYMERWGREKVTQFIDHVLRIDTLVDYSKAWEQREIRDVVIRDRREVEQPRRLNVPQDRLYMEPWLNPKRFRDQENERISREETARDLGLFSEPTKDIMGFIRDYAPLKPWQSDIMAMLYEDAMYFAPQRATKMINEGFASWVDYHLMTKEGLVSLGQPTHDSGIIQYALHKTAVLGGKYSLNPYKIGYMLLCDVEERWNKGQFGDEWDNCRDAKAKENWDRGLGLGKQKVFELRKYYNDVILLNEFFTQDFCDRNEFYMWRHFPSGEYKIETRDAKVIKRRLLKRYINGGFPDIRLVDPNHRGRGWMFLQHYWDDQVLDERNARETLTSLYFLWGKEVCLATKNENDEELVFYCSGLDPEKDILLMAREEYEKRWR